MAQTTVPLNTPTEQPTRREMLGRVAFAGAAGALSAAGVAQAAAHPDAGLLQAARRWREAGLAWLRDPDEDVSNAANDEFERLDAIITALPACTAAGVAAKLRVALLHSGLMGNAEEFLLGCGAYADGLFETQQQELTWQAIEALEQLAGRA